jgi:hypothetical protein
MGLPPLCFWAHRMFVRVVFRGTAAFTRCGLLLGSSPVLPVRKLLTVRELRSSGWYAGWWVTSCSATEKDIYTLVKNFMILFVLKKLLSSQ